MHVATGRSDHLGGRLTPDLFANKKNAHARRHPLLAEQDPGDQRPASASAPSRGDVVLIENLRARPPTCAACWP
ncbi:MAG: hypothetical protein WDN28_10925 [Chthoniobacter sp.]